MKDKIYFKTSEVSVAQLADHCEQSISLDDYRFAAGVEKNVVIYDAKQLMSSIAHDKQAVVSELHSIISTQGPGVLVIKHVVKRSTSLIQHNQLFDRILTREGEQQSGSYLFAATGANGRIWNALQKTAELEPDLFIDYYKNPVIGLVAEAWLGPHWQMSSQINIVRPGAKAQQPHRDYHLGFQNMETCVQYPCSVHKMSTQLTLQGAIAHSDMPIETGPTQLLPFSHQYELGYLAWRDPAIVSYFNQHHVQLPLSAGDAIFFNPAMFHAAGHNHTKAQHRTANLLQISSAFGKTMESIDRTKILNAIYPSLRARYRAATLSESELDAIIACSGDGYSFPTNLDLDPPSGEMAPETMQALTLRALQQDWGVAKFKQALADKFHQRQA